MNARAKRQGLLTSMPSILSSMLVSRFASKASVLSSLSGDSFFGFCLSMVLPGPAASSPVLSASLSLSLSLSFSLSLSLSLSFSRLSSLES